MVRAVQISRCLELPEISTQNTEILFYQLLPIYLYQGAQ
jgi:hypothetical protein